MDGSEEMRPPPLERTDPPEAGAEGEIEDDFAKAIGTKLGKFVIIGELGRGSMGVVYEAYQEDLRRKVAIKVLPANVSLDQKQVRRFHREAQSTAGLRHTNVIQIHEVGHEKRTHYFVMEFVDGRPLSTFRAPDLTGIREAARIARDAARGLDHAHANGVIHRDIKPGNLLIDREGRVVVTDFGLARLTESASLTSTDAIVGTPKYMSPEQILPGTKPLDGRTDVYSLGATLYEVLTHRPPFEAPSVQAFIRAILEERPQSPRKHNKKIPPDLATIILRCLEKDPVERYGSASEMADDLERFLGGTPIVAKPKGAVALAGEFVRRHRIIVSLSAVTLVAAITALVVLAKSGQTRAQSTLRKQILEAESLPDLNQRIGALARLYEGNPKSIDARRALGVAHRSRGYARLHREDLETGPGALADLLRAEELISQEEKDEFWILMLLVELDDFEQAKRRAARLPEDSILRALTLARIDTKKGDNERAIARFAVLSLLAEFPHAYYYLTQGEALLGRAQRLKMEDADESERKPLLIQAEQSLEMAAQVLRGQREEWLRARVQIKLLEVSNLLRKPFNLAAVLRDFGGVAKELLRNLAIDWSGMTPQERGVAEAYVRTLLAFTGKPQNVLATELFAEANRTLAGQPKPEEEAGARLILALVYMSAGDLDAAEEQLDFTFDVAGESHNAYAYLGLSLIQRARGMENAEEAHEMALQGLQAAVVAKLDSTDLFGRQLQHATLDFVGSDETRRKATRERLQGLAQPDSGLGRLLQRTLRRLGPAPKPPEKDPAEGG